MDSANTFNSLKPDLKDTYADGNTKKFKKTRKSLQGIGLSLHKASQNPKKYMKDQDMDITTKKGLVV
jgi:hypothetical protein